MGTGEFNAADHPTIDKHSIQGGVEILLVSSCHRYRDKFWAYMPLGWYADLTLPSPCQFAKIDYGPEFFLYSL